MDGSPSEACSAIWQIAPRGENITDVWAAQSSSDGRDYAYLGSFDDIACTFDTTGTHIVDITNPTAPTKVAFISDKAATRTNDVKVAHLETRHFAGEILVASNEPCGSQFVPRLNSNGVSGNAGRGGVSIWDVTDPTKPKALRQNYLDFGVHNTFIWQQGDNAYMLVVDDDNVQDVHIVDINKPQSPREIAVTGQLDWPTLSDNIGVGEVFLHDVWVQDNGGTVIAYLSYWDAGLVLLDVTDPENIVELDQFATENVFANPPLLGDRTMHNVVVDGGTTAYISWYAEGMRVVDFSGDVLTETYHFVDTVDGSNFWGVYLYDHSDGNTYILGSDRTTGLWIFDTP